MVNNLCCFPEWRVFPKYCTAIIKRGRGVYHSFIKQRKTIYVLSLRSLEQEDLLVLDIACLAILAWAVYPGCFLDAGGFLANDKNTMSHLLMPRELFSPADAQLFTLVIGVHVQLRTRVIRQSQGKCQQNIVNVWHQGCSNNCFKECGFLPSTPWKQGLATSRQQLGTLAPASSHSTHTCKFIKTKCYFLPVYLLYRQIPSCSYTKWHKKQFCQDKHYRNSSAKLIWNQFEYTTRRDSY